MCGFSVPQKYLQREGIHAYKVCISLMLSHLCLADVLSCRGVEARVLYVRRIPVSRLHM
jgi:hypothetical protein